MIKKMVVCMLAISFMLTGCKNSEKSVVTDIDSIKLESNQEIVIGKITQISGNEITYTVAEEVDASNMPERSSGESRNQDGNMPERPNGEMPENSSMPERPNGEMPENSSMPERPSGEMPEDGSMPERPSGEMPEDGSMPERPSGEMSEDGSKSERSGKEKSDSTDSPKENDTQTMYTLTEESDTKIIPVGTTVFTTLGNETTFSRLSNGDVIKMLVETDSDGEQTIIGIWMV